MLKDKHLMIGACFLSAYYLGLAVAGGLAGMLFGFAGFMIGAYAATKVRPTLVYIFAIFLFISALFFTKPSKLNLEHKSLAGTWLTSADNVNIKIEFKDSTALVSLPPNQQQAVFDIRMEGDSLHLVPEFGPNLRWQIVHLTDSTFEAQAKSGRATYRKVKSSPGEEE